ncbi:MAG: hypothetical protein JWM89_2754 [Acidimicrobiales bacterium]|nr:hypothetical protein [Acidimicrobiales bacterium]
MASVRRCIDCDVVLVDEVDPVAADPGATGSTGAVAASPLGDGDQIGYELDGWGNPLKVTLAGMLDRAGIRHVWESNALVVAASDEEEVDELVATVEGGEVVEGLDEDLPKVAFEIEGLDPDELADLDARLIAAHIAHAWEEDGALLVSEDDDDVVAAIIDEVLAGPDEDEGDGLAAQQALSELYVSVDKLMKDPTDKKLARRFTAAADAIVGLAVPYGLSGADWESLGEDVVALAESVRPPAASNGDEPGPESEPESDPEGEAMVEDEIEAAVEGELDTVQQEVEPADEAPVPTAAEVARERARSLRGRLQELV